MSKFEEQKKIVLKNLTKTSSKKKKDKKDDEENDKLKTKVYLCDAAKMEPIFKVYLN